MPPIGSPRGRHRLPVGRRHELLIGAVLVDLIHLPSFTNKMRVLRFRACERSLTALIGKAMDGLAENRIAQPGSLARTARRMPAARDVVQRATVVSPAAVMSSAKSAPSA